MTDSLADAQRRALVRVACGRIAAGAAAIVEAHRLGIAEGPHEQPWTPEYHRDAVRIYAETLPPAYEIAVAALFGPSADAMDGGTIPARLAEDWIIVHDYLRCASEAISAFLPTPDSVHHAAEALSTQIEAQDTPPTIIHYDELAALTTREGAGRLQRAAAAVRAHLEHPAPETLDDRERHLLTRLSEGAAIAQIAVEVGYSERSIYRALASLWKKLGVPGRADGVSMALAEGLLKSPNPAG